MADSNATPGALPPHVQIIQMGTAYWVSQFVFTAANIRLADHLADGPKSAGELAGVTGTTPRTLHRFMRTLASLGLLTQAGADRFALTPLGAALKSDAPGSARSTVMAMAGPPLWEAFGAFQYSLETGKTAVEKVCGMPMFDYLAQHPQEAAQFSEAMVGIHGAEPPAVAAAYDFSPFGTIVDVGGATGNMLGHVLKRHPQPRGVLFDRPHVVTEAPKLLQAHGVADRVSIAHGDFFESVPAGGDAYILSHIIHDWNEAQCQTILGHCRAVMTPGSKLLIVEFVLPEGDTPHFGKIADMVMLTAPGGEERTADEYRSLLAAAGLNMTRVVPTASDVSVVEAELA
ncbi:MAG: methyltransferase [Vicinamibacteraceae bacterium]